MEDEKKLVPCRVSPIVDEYAWGIDEFKLADLGYRDSLVADGWLAGNTLSEVMDTYMDRVVGDNVYEYYGRQFPVQLKYIKVSGDMPLRVHPGDELAAQRYDLLGREKLWYVLEAGADARLHLGFAHATDASAVLGAIADGSLPGMLNVVPVQAGQCFHIAPGTVHGASGHLTIVEVSESSALDFPVWGAQPGTEEFDPALSLVDALEFIDFGAFAAENEVVPEPSEAGGQRLTSLPQFSVTLRSLEQALRTRIEGPGAFTLYSCLRGAASVQAVDSHRFAAGETLLIPAEVEEFTLVPLEPGTQVLEITVEHRSDPDSYTGSSVEEAAAEPDGGE